MLMVLIIAFSHSNDFGYCPQFFFPCTRGTTRSVGGWMLSIERRKKDAMILLTGSQHCKCNILNGDHHKWHRSSLHPLSVRIVAAGTSYIGVGDSATYGKIVKERALSLLLLILCDESPLIATVYAFSFTRLFTQPITTQLCSMEMRCHPDRNATSMWHTPSRL